MRRLNYGGQAVMEGVMMRGEREWAVCVRAPSGEIVTHREVLPAALYRSRWARLPFLRGLVLLWDALGLGLRALMWSADVALGEQEEVRLQGPVGWATLAASLAFGIGLFFLLPAFLVGLLDRVITSALWSNVAEGALRLALFIGYLWAIGQMPDIRRVFAYHGAEHKTINAYEAGAPLEPQEVARFSCAHTRSGTGFFLWVMLLFIFLSILMGRPPLLGRIAIRLALIPLVAGLSYEVIRLAARYYERSALVRWMMAPGLALQRLTTREPDAGMLEVSIHALKQVLEAEGLLEQDAEKGISPYDATT